MKQLFILCLLLSPIMLCTAQEGKQVTVVEFAHPPFAYQDPQTKEAKGAEIAFLTAVLKDLGYQPTFTFVPFPRMLTMLQAGEADVGPFLTKTADREVFANYSTQSVLTMLPVIIVLNDSPLKTL